MSRILITVVCILFCLNAVGQSIKDIIKISPVDNRYPKEKYLQFNIANKGDKNIYIVFALEKRSNGHWYEVLDDIFRLAKHNSSKRTTTFTLEAGKNLTVKWEPASAGIKINGHYRFKIYYDYKPSDYDSSLVSDEFFAVAAVR
jgi:hypothetical protein